MSLQKKISHGLKWTSIAHFSQTLFRFSTTLFLLRYISPSDYGLVGMTTVFIGFASIFKDLGSASAVVQKKDISEKFLSSIFWGNILIGFLITSIIFLVSRAAAIYYQEPRLTLILQVLSFTFLISSLGNIQQALLSRNLCFDDLAKVRVISILIGSIFGIISAISDLGYWSLVIQSLTISACTSILCWYFSSWSPKLVFDLAEFSAIKDYSFHITFSSVFFYFVRNTDDFLIAKFIGTQALGYYAFAYRLLLMPIQTLGDIVQRVTFPVFSRQQEDDVWLRQGILRSISAILFIILPIISFVYIQVDSLVQVFLSEQWLPSIIIIKILLPAAVIESMETVINLIYKVKNRTDIMFKLAIPTGILCMLAFTIGIRWGVVGVAISYVCTLPLSILNFIIAFSLVKLTFVDLIQAIIKPLLSSLLMVGTVFFLSAHLNGIVTIGLIRILILCFTALLSYLLASWLINKEQLKEVVLLGR